MYSDYYFLDDSMRPVQPGKSAAPLLITTKQRRKLNDDDPLVDATIATIAGSDLGKSAKQFHARAKQQIDEFNDCVRIYEARLQSDHTLLGLDRIGPSNSLLLLPIWFRASQM